MEITDNIIQQWNDLIAEHFETKPETTQPFTVDMQRSPRNDFPSSWGSQWVTKFDKKKNLIWEPYYRYANNDEDSRKLEIYLIEYLSDVLYQEALREYRKILSEVLLDKKIYYSEILTEEELSQAKPWQRAFAFIKFHNLEDKLPSHLLRH